MTVGATICDGTACTPGAVSTKGAVACDLCPAGTYLGNPGGKDRDSFTAGYGNLALGLPNGGDDMVNCHFDQCVNDCTCNVLCGMDDAGHDGCSGDFGAFCDGGRQCPGNVGLPDFVNGLRICGAARQSSIGWGGEPGYALARQTNCAKTHGKPTDSGPTFWQVELDVPARISQVRILQHGPENSIGGETSRDSAQGHVNMGVRIYVSATANYTSSGVLCGIIDETVLSPTESGNEYVTMRCPGATGEYITLVDAEMDVPANSFMMELCQVEVWGTIGCIPCPAGSISGNGSTECTPCPQYTFAPEGATECVGCEPGQYLTDGLGTCGACPAGRYDHDSAVQTDCVECEPGEYLGSAGEASLSSGVSPCLACLAGTSSGAGAASCTACISSEYDDDLDPKTPCVACPEASIGAADHLSCEACDPGRVLIVGQLGGGGLDATGSHAELWCKSCPRGRVQTGDVCEELPAGCSNSLVSTDPSTCQTCNPPVSPADGALHPNFSPELSHCILSPHSKSCEAQCSACSAARTMATGWTRDNRSKQAKVAALRHAYYNAWHPQTSPAAVSTKSCSQLCSHFGGGWCSSDPNFFLGSDLTCGESDNGLNGGADGCFQSTWAEADEICSSVGARLCTVAELQADETRASGCGFDDKWVWSSHQCDGGHVVAQGGSGKSKLQNVALNKTTSMSVVPPLVIAAGPDWFKELPSDQSGRAVDGDTNRDAFSVVQLTVSCTHSLFAGEAEGVPDWWQVDLGEAHQMQEIKIYHRSVAGCDECQDRLQGTQVIVSATPDYTIR